MSMGTRWEKTLVLPVTEKRTDDSAWVALGSTSLCLRLCGHPDCSPWGGSVMQALLALRRALGGQLWTSLSPSTMPGKGGQ